MTARYEGKPLLRILECYVLWAIGELGNVEEAKLSGMEPQLRQALKQQGNWREVIEKAMEFPGNMPEMIRANWEKNQSIAKQQHRELAPQQFAEMFVDSNLVD
jgi:formate dehydrogenase maturation protein FdhE